MRGLRPGTDGDHRWLLKVARSSSVVGFATLVNLASTEVGYLEFLAISTEDRNRGLGGEALRFIANSCPESVSASGIVLEVESDHDTSVHDHGLRRRRIAFYRRNGVVPIECAPNYRIPSAGGGPGVAMQLMWLPVRGVSSPPTGNVLRQCITSIYSQAYSRPGQDPLLRSVLEGLTC